MSADANQLTLFCRGCCGSDAVVITQADRHGEPVQVPAPCPACRPRASSREVWLATVRLVERLTAAAQR